MDDIVYIFSRIEDRPVNFVEVMITTELGCDPAEGEYTLHLVSIIGYLDLTSYGGVDDISLIKECIENSLEELKLPEEGCTQVILEESGEWEDVFWHKYYNIKRVCRVGGYL